MGQFDKYNRKEQDKVSQRRTIGNSSIAESRGAFNAGRGDDK